ncbi:hypothetical protein PR202_gb08853 [Eleusine coracana subsp. coracana]|uniref:SKP1-like protein n=1 Tax=Eleusine coracana subsp. coracana TaxID=191504 RepID=A0AAV5EG96_ELECO|nr:hypothetical protein QOZ80_2BG0190280 [Eleusine coracana subsp. coracana]GJN21383.1 hypothetical protein PR202_gb08853 [Eleusine coracana subsp. coracana]
MGSPGTKMIRLVSSDGRAFDVPEKTIAAASGTIKSMLDAGHAADAVPVPNVTAATLTRVLDYAANVLRIDKLLDLTCEAVADLIRGKTPEEIRSRFNIIDDYSEEEEEEVRRENSWAFE